MNDKTLIQAMQQYGTPAYIFDTAAFEKKLQDIRHIFGDSVSLCYSIKANPFLIPAALEVCDRLEVCSPGELEICEKLHVPMEKVVYSGVNKEPWDVARAIRDGVGFVTAESLRHVMIIQEAAAQAGGAAGAGKLTGAGGPATAGDLAGAREPARTAGSAGAGEPATAPRPAVAMEPAAGRKGPIPVLLRLNSGAQFGMSKEDLLYVISHRSEYPDIRICGIHYFAGTQRKNRGLHQQKEELAMLEELMQAIQTENGSFMELEYGPGLPVALFQGEDFSEPLAPARELAPVLQQIGTQSSGRIRVTVEAGRFFATDCGYYLTKVMDLKSVGDKHYCITDGGIHHVTYLGQLMGMKQPVMRHFIGNGDPDADPRQVYYQPYPLSANNAPGQISDASGNAKVSSSLDVTDGSNASHGTVISNALNTSGIGTPQVTYAICGSLCTTNDDLVRSCTMEELHLGDILVFENIGAYSVTEGIYLFLSRRLPRILLCDAKGNLQLVRDRLATSTWNTPDMAEPPDAGSSNRQAFSGTGRKSKPQKA